FFFQAEDGIRDRNVTGVQTCALPISHNNPAVFSDFLFLTGILLYMDAVFPDQYLAIQTRDVPAYPEYLKYICLFRKILSGFPDTASGSSVVFPDFVFLPAASDFAVPGTDGSDRAPMQLLLLLPEEFPQN